jgi:hypothetical protein
MIRAITQELDNFVTEFATAVEHTFVDHRPVSEEIVDALKRMQEEQKSEPLVARS